MTTGNEVDWENVDPDTLTQDQKVDLLLRLGTTLVPAVQRLEKSRRGVRIALGATVIIGALFIGTFSGGYFVSKDTSDTVADQVTQALVCIQQYEIAYANRAQIISDASQRRVDSQQAVFDTIPNPKSGKPFDQAAFDAALQVEHRIADEYNQSLKDNPFPPLPTFNCQSGVVNSGG